MKRIEYSKIIGNRRLVSITESATDAIIVANEKSHIVLWNKSASKMFGHSSSEAIGQPLNIIMPKQYWEAHNKGMARFVATGNKTAIGKTIEIVGQKKDGTIFPIELSLSTWKEDGLMFFAGIVRDITVRKNNEQLIQKSLEEKELLLKEIHHRVKNNLQIIISLLKIYSNNIHPEAINVFKECQDKIHAMALVHSSMYMSNDFENVNLAEYITTYRKYFLEVTLNDRIETTLKLDDTCISMENAVNFGLILSELFSNFYKHTIPTTAIPKLEICLRKQDETFKFTFSDNGPGICQSRLNCPEQTTYGLELIRGLVEQMDGIINIRTQKGTTFEIELPLRDRSAERISI